MEKYYTTKSGFRRFVDQLKAVAERYDKIVATNDDAADAGDNSVWHDNFAYEENQRQMHQWAQRFTEMEKIKSNMVIIDIDKNPEKVKIGCKVLVYECESDIEKTNEIAGYNDGEPSLNRVSYNSPIAKALIGAEIGEVRKLKIENNVKEMEVLDIFPLAD